MKKILASGAAALLSSAAAASDVKPQDVIDSLSPYAMIGGVALVAGPETLKMPVDPPNDPARSTIIRRDEAPQPVPSKPRKGPQSPMTETLPKIVPSVAANAGATVNADGVLQVIDHKWSAFETFYKHEFMWAHRPVHSNGPGH